MKSLNCPTFKPTAPKKEQAVKEWLTQLEVEIEAYWKKTESKKCYNALKKHYNDLKASYSQEIYKGKVKQEIDAVYNTINNKKRIADASAETNPCNSADYTPITSCTEPTPPATDSRTDDVKQLCAAIYRINGNVFKCRANYCNSTTQACFSGDTKTQNTLKTLNLAAVAISSTVNPEATDSAVYLYSVLRDLYTLYTGSTADWIIQDFPTLVLEDSTLTNGADALNKFAGTSTDYSDIFAANVTNNLLPAIEAELLNLPNSTGAVQGNPFSAENCTGINDYINNGDNIVGIQSFKFHMSFFAIADALTEIYKDFDSSNPPAVPSFDCSKYSGGAKTILCPAVNKILPHKDAYKANVDTLSKLATTGNFKSVTQAADLVNILQDFLTFYTTPTGTPTFKSNIFVPHVLPEPKYNLNWFLTEATSDLTLILGGHLDNTVQDSLNVNMSDILTKVYGNSDPTTSPFQQDNATGISDGAFIFDTKFNSIYTAISKTLTGNTPKPPTPTIDCSSYSGKAQTLLCPAVNKILPHKDAYQANVDALSVLATTGNFKDVTQAADLVDILQDFLTFYTTHTGITKFKGTIFVPHVLPDATYNLNWFLTKATSDLTVILGGHLDNTEPSSLNVNMSDILTKVYGNSAPTTSPFQQENATGISNEAFIFDTKFDSIYTAIQTTLKGKPPTN